MTTDEILDILEEMFPDAHCELEHRNASVSYTHLTLPTKA